MASKTIKIPSAIKMIHKILFKPKFASGMEERVEILALEGVMEVVEVWESVLEDSSLKSISSSKKGVFVIF